MEFVAEPYEGPWDTAEVVRYLDPANMEFWTNKGKYFPVANRLVIDTAHRLPAADHRRRSFEEKS